MDSFPKLMRSLREDVAMTRAELAERMGVHIETVRSYERGHRRPRSWGRITSLCESLELEDNDILRLQRTILDPIVGELRTKPNYDPDTGVQTNGRHALREKGQTLHPYTTVRGISGGRSMAGDGKPQPKKIDDVLQTGEHVANRHPDESVPRDASSASLQSPPGSMEEATERIREYMREHDLGQLIPERETNGISNAETEE